MAWQALLGTLGSSTSSNAANRQQILNQYGNVGWSGLNGYVNIAGPKTYTNKGAAIAQNLFDPGGQTGIWDKWLNSGDDVEYDPYWAYTPEQKAMHQKLGPYLTNKLGSGLNLYTGDYTSPLTQSEWDVINQNARLSALGEQGLTPLLKGEFPEQYYRDTIYQPLLKQYQEDTQPALEEQYAGPSGGGYWGSARAGAVGNGYRDLGDTLAAKRAELAWQVQQNVPNAVNAANALSTTGAAIQQTPRLIKQYGLDQQYNEWVRASVESQKYIDQAINFMGLSSGVMDIGNTNIPENTGALGNLGQLTQLASLFGNQGGSNNNYYSDWGASDVGSTYTTGQGLGNYGYSSSTPSYSSYTPGITNAYNTSSLNAINNMCNYQYLNNNY